MVYVLFTKYKPLKIGISVALGGLISNLINKIFTGGVVDFLVFPMFNGFLIINLADAFVVVGVIVTAYKLYFMLGDKAIVMDSSDF